MIDYLAYCTRFHLPPDALASARAYRHYCQEYQKRAKTLKEVEDELREKYRHDTKTDAVEKNALLAIINGNHAETDRLLDIIKRRNKGFRVINNPHAL